MLAALLDKSLCGCDVKCRAMTVKFQMTLSNNGILVKAAQRDMKADLHKIEMNCTFIESDNQLDIYKDGECKYSITKTDEGYLFNKYDGIVYYLIEDFPLKLIV